MRSLVAAVYKLEGDGLEILLAHLLVEELRERGRSLGKRGMLPNVDAVLRADAKLVQGVKIRKFWIKHGGWFDAKIVSTVQVESTLEPDKIVQAWTVKYDADNTTEDLEEHEIRPLLDTLDMPERKDIVDALAPGFLYLENRLTGNCDAPYDCSDTYELFRLARLFDPAFAAMTKPGADDVKELVAIASFAERGDALLDGMISELPKYLAAAAQLTVERDDVHEFTDSVLQFWRTHASELKCWALAARIMFALAPSSASCERVFSLLDSCFGREQLRSLSDYIEASLMLIYNTRRLG